MRLLIRSRQMHWSALLLIAVVVATTVAADWLADTRNLGPESRVPVVTLGALLCAMIAGALLITADDDLEASTSRPPRTAIAAAAVAVAAILAVSLAVLIRYEPINRGGIEAARNVVGLIGLALISAALAGNRLAWLLPFGYLSIVYFTAPRQYDENPTWSLVCWLMYPARFGETFLVAAALFLLGLLSYLTSGRPPLPTWHPRR